MLHPSRLAFLALLLLALCARPAGARMAPCRPDGSGPLCQVRNAQVTGVNDGDTIFVRLRGDRSRHVYTIRFSGVQAMELHRYDNHHPSKWRGECEAVPAGRLVYRMLRRAHWRVRLSYEGATYTDSRGRLFRSLAVRYGQRWHDLGVALMARGLTLWMPRKPETAWNAIYNRLEQRAAQRQLGLFDPNACGRGPARDVPLRVLVQSNPLGDDLINRNGEWVQIRNLSATKPIDLSGWWLRDSGKPYHFPGGTTIAPGGRLTVHVGQGQDSATDLFWGLDRTLFENSADGGGMGNGAYLFDPQGAVRASMIYPCLVACSDPNQGALTITAHPRRPEYVVVRNVSDHRVDLDGYAVDLPSQYTFGPGSVLQPGEDLEVYVGGTAASDTSTVRHAGWSSGPLLRDRGGVVRLATLNDITLACDAWGDRSC